MSKVEFWYDFASTYSYLSACRIEAEADKRGIELIWRPFLLGPIFHAQGWNNSPFNIYPQKGKYMWRDMQREAEKYNLPLCEPSKDIEFPQNSVLAARLALVGFEEGWGVGFSKAVYLAEWGDGLNISSENTLKSIIDKLGHSGEKSLQKATSQPFKDKLRKNTEDAINKNIFGAPSFTIGDELFWGNDRMEDALDWALSIGRSEINP